MNARTTVWTAIVPSTIGFGIATTCEETATSLFEKHSMYITRVVLATWSPLCNGLENGGRGTEAKRALYGVYMLMWLKWVEGVL